MALASHIFDGKFEITANVQDFISYLHYDNKMAVVDGFSIKSLDGKTHTDVSIAIRLTSTETDFAEVLVVQFPEVTPGGADETINLKLIPSLFNSITANRTAELEFEVLKGDASLGTFSATTELYPLNSWKLGAGRDFQPVSSLTTFRNLLFTALIHGKEAMNMTVWNQCLQPKENSTRIQRPIQTA